MNSNLFFDFTVDKANATVNVTREFAAELSKVWAAWTTAELLDLWWAPKPYRAETKRMDFRPGGRWHYAMVSPEGQKHWGLQDYDTVDTLKSFSHRNAFCDENENFDESAPRSKWFLSFDEKDGKTTVSIVIKHDTLEILEKYIAMGFKEGFTMGLGNLEALLDSQK